MVRLIIVFVISAVALLSVQIAFVHRWMDKAYFPDTLIRDCRQFRQDDKRFLQYARKLRKENCAPDDEMNAYFQKYGDMANQFRGGVFLFKMEVIFNTVCDALLMGVVAAFPSEICGFLSNLCLKVFSISFVFPPLIFILISYPFIIGELFYTFFQKWKVQNRQNLTILLDGYTKFLNGFEMRLGEFVRSSVTVKKRHAIYVALRVLMYLGAIVSSNLLIYGSYLSFAYMQIRPSVVSLLSYYVSLPWNILSVFCALAAFGCFKFQEFLFGSGYDSPEGCFRERFQEWRSFRKKAPPSVQGALKPWEQDCIKMCETLRIYGVFIEEETNETRIAYTNRLKSGKITVYFSSADIQKWKAKPDYYDMVKFILAHELAHISAGDLVDKSERISAFACLLLCVTPFILGVYWRVSSSALALLVAYTLFMKIAVVDTCTDERFWGQIKELRADRIGMLASGVSMETFRNAVQEESNLGTANKVQQGKKAEIEPDPHPSSETRIRELERHQNQPWKLVDYLRYAVQYWRKLRLSKEWRL